MPRLGRLPPRLLEFAGGDVLVAHNAGFDTGVIVGTSRAYGLDVPDFRSLCSLQVARKTYHLESYRLPAAAMAAGFEDFSHHDALADAEACAAIVVHAAKRHEADDLEALAHITRVQFGAIGPVATRERGAVHGPMALQLTRSPPRLARDVGGRCHTCGMEILMLLIGLVVGALLGGLAALLFAQRRGSEVDPDAPVADDPALVEARHQAALAEVRAGEEAAKSLLREELAATQATGEALRERIVQAQQQYRELVERQQAEAEARAAREPPRARCFRPSHPFASRSPRCR